jgi:hypothetical protein
MCGVIPTMGLDVLCNSSRLFKPIDVLSVAVEQISLLFEQPDEEVSWSRFVVTD